MPTGIGTGLLLSSIIGGASSIAGGALANKGKASTTSTNTSNSTSTSMPTISPEYSPMARTINDMVMKRLQTGTDLSGYTAGGLSNINRGAALAKMGSDADLTARGLATSPVAGVVDSNRNLARVGQGVQFQNTIPLLQRDLQTQDLDMGSRILSAFGRGQTNTSSGTSTGTGTTTTESGGGAAGAFTNLAGYMGYLSGSGAFGGGGNNTGFVDPNRFRVPAASGSYGPSPSPVWGKVVF